MFLAYVVSLVRHCAKAARHALASHMVRRRRIALNKESKKQNSGVHLPKIVNTAKTRHAPISTARITLTTIGG